jgi:2',5'-phosphodiesterase
VKDDEWTPNLVSPLKSAYAVKNGVEPNFTNYAKVKEDPIFCDTLDYIFYASPSSSSHDELTVKECLPLPHRDTVAGPLPNEDEPSDHIMIASEFTFKKSD